jgi:hypothetical protein
MANDNEAQVEDVNTPAAAAAAATSSGNTAFLTPFNALLMGCLGGIGQLP